MHQLRWLTAEFKLIDQSAGSAMFDRILHALRAVRFAEITEASVSFTTTIRRLIKQQRVFRQFPADRGFCPTFVVSIMDRGCAGRRGVGNSMAPLRSSLSSYRNRRHSLPTQRPHRIH